LSGSANRRRAFSESSGLVGNKPEEGAGVQQDIHGVSPENRATVSSGSSSKNLISDNLQPVHF